MRQPTQRDLSIYEAASAEMLDDLHSGFSGFIFAAGNRMVHHWAGPLRDQVVVELGCGSGHHMSLAEEPYGRYVGLDIDKNVLRVFKTRRPESVLVNGDAHSLPFRDGSVACVVSIYNLEHLRQLDQALSEIERILRPGGELLAALPAEGGFLYGLGREVTTKRRVEAKYKIDYNAIIHYQHCNDYQQVATLVARRFRVLEKRFLPFRLIPSVHVSSVVCIRASKR